ncbi:MAG TPA: hypothetical protein VFW57_14975 [Acidimicrobiia bacterium]|nr:hypothetical protein [Acidimicrobiia bacterium]
MASGLQCPGCGHVHPAGLPEIARGDATFRCYGCYRMLSVPDGWSGRPTARSATPGMSPTEDAPAGAGTRDARNARLAGRGRLRGSALTEPSAGAPPTDLAPRLPAAAPGPAAGANASGAPRRMMVGRLELRRPDPPTLPAGIRFPVWAAAFGVSLMITAFVLRKMGILSVNAIIDLYAGTGLGRFGILLILLPMWAALSATIAHLSLETLAKRRRRPKPSSVQPPVTTSARR